MYPQFMYYDNKPIGRQKCILYNVSDQEIKTFICETLEILMPKVE